MQCKTHLTDLIKVVGNVRDTREFYGIKITLACYIYNMCLFSFTLFSHISMFCAAVIYYNFL